MTTPRPSAIPNLTPAARVAAIVDALPAAIIRERTFNWETTIELRVFGAGTFSIEVSPAGCVVAARPAIRPKAVIILDVATFLRIYEGPPIDRILEAMKTGAVRTNDFEQLVVFARAFDHAAIGSVLAANVRAGGAVAADAPSLVERASAEASYGAALLRGARHRSATWLEASTDRLSYRLGRVRLERRALDGFEWIVSTACGLHAVSRTAVVRIVRGVFNGVTIRDGAIYAYQQNDHFLSPTKMGRILRLGVARSRIESVEVAASGLDNNCHQIDFAGDKLLVADTYNDRVFELDLFGGAEKVHYPLGDAMSKDPLRPVRSAHINCLFARGDRVYLMCHNSSDWTGKRSELLECDRAFRVIRRIPLAGRCCHNVVVLGDDDIRYCSSEASEVRGPGGTWLSIDERMFVRGLSIGEHVVAVGASEITYRADRFRSAGRVYFFEPNGARRGHITLPGAPREIRRLDGCDWTLSNYRPERALTTDSHHRESEVHP
jgi:hypothetical protein